MDNETPRRSHYSTWSADQLQQGIAALGRLSQDPAFGFVLSRVQADIEATQDELVEARELVDVHRAQGAAKALLHVLTMPQEIAADMRRCLEGIEKVSAVNKRADLRRSALDAITQAD